jgi:glycosyltransferase involved in cell wall biosynthesis
MIGLVAARLLGVPLVFHGHSRMEEELPSYVSSRRARRLLARVGAWLDRTIPPRADHCLAVTAALAEVLRRHGARRVTALRPIADPGETGELGPPDPEAAAPTIGYAGNLDGYQNLGLLLDAFREVRKEIPAARLLVVTHVPIGTPPGFGAAGVDLLRVETAAEAWRAIGRAWVAVVPRVDPSGHPMKVLNYMAAGKAIVTTAGAAHGLTHDLDAAVVVDAEPKAFASAIAELLRDPERRARLGATAREAATSAAAWDETMRTLEDVYRSVQRRAEPTCARRIVR